MQKKIPTIFTTLAKLISQKLLQKILKMEQIVYTTSIFIWLLLHECQLEEKNVSKRLMKDHKMAKK